MHGRLQDRPLRGGGSALLEELASRHEKGPPWRRLSPSVRQAGAAGVRIHDGLDRQGGSQLPESP